jgi:hypothetical protein
MSEFLDTAKAISQIAANAATTLVAGAAAFWFFFSRRFSKRVEFDAEFQLFESGDPETNILQVALLLENKGYLEHRLYTLAFEVVEMLPDGTSVSNPNMGFVYRSGNVVELEAVYYYVRPGVRQRFVKALRVPARVKLAKVRAFFTYSANRLKIDLTKPTLPQRLVLPDWTALVRVVDLKSQPVAARASIPETRRPPSEAGLLS